VEIGVQRSRGERREIPVGDRVGKKERRSSNASLSRGEIRMRKIVKRKIGLGFETGLKLKFFARD
jgi:hypothetical protein